jgi:hypothetical protein
MNGLKIVSEGRLLRTRWVYDEDKDKGCYVTDDVTDKAPSYLFDACTLEEGVVLEDIFQLLERHLDVYKTVMGDVIKDVVKEGLQPYTGEEKELEYLELYWGIDYDEDEKEFPGNILPGFHGIGIAGEIPYCLMLTPANEIAGLPLKLCQEFIVSSNTKYEIFEGPQFSLGQILYGIIWELSWFGSPEERERKKQELAQS